MVVNNGINCNDFIRYRGTTALGTQCERSVAKVGRISLFPHAIGGSKKKKNFFGSKNLTQKFSRSSNINCWLNDKWSKKFVTDLKKHYVLSVLPWHTATFWRQQLLVIKLIQDIRCTRSIQFVKNRNTIKTYRHIHLHTQFI